MNTSSRRSLSIFPLLHTISNRRGLAWGLILLVALLAFEIFNFSTTQFALADVLGDLRFLGLRWATILAVAFCGIDFAGIARLFTPEQGRDEPAEVWYLFGAWLLAAAMNATLTWWGVSVAIASKGGGASELMLAPSTLSKTVPVFVAVLVWLIRVLLIGTFSVAGERLFTQMEAPPAVRQALPQASPAATLRPRPVTPASVTTATLRPASRLNRTEPAYSASPGLRRSVQARPYREAEYVNPEQY